MCARPATSMCVCVCVSKPARFCWSKCFHSPTEIIGIDNTRTMLYYMRWKEGKTCKHIKPEFMEPSSSFFCITHGVYMYVYTFIHSCSLSFSENVWHPLLCTECFFVVDSTHYRQYKNIHNYIKYNDKKRFTSDFSERVHIKQLELNFGIRNSKSFHVIYFGFFNSEFKKKSSLNIYFNILKFLKNLIFLKTWCKVYFLKNTKICKCILKNLK